MKPLSKKEKTIIILLLAMITVLPFFLSSYLKHILILIFIWSAISTAWTFMGRFGMLSLGHGAVMGIGSFTTALLFNYYGLSPWIGMIIGALMAVIFFAGIGYFCFRFQVVSHYFAVISLVQTIVVFLVIIIFRNFTGGALGITLNRLGTSPLFFQFENKNYFYFIGLGYLLLTMYIWRKIDGSRLQRALTAIGDDEAAASSVGISIVKYKTIVAVISSFMTAVGAVIYSQYMMFLHPDVIASTDASLNIPFKAVLGGMYSLFGPFIGTSLVIGLEEYFRVLYGSSFIGWSMVGYGIALVIIIIFLPKGLYGTLSEKLGSKKSLKNILTPEKIESRT